MRIQTFVNRLNIKADVVWADSNPHMKDFQGNHFKVTLKMGRKRLTVPFSQGYGVSGEPKAVDVVNCLVSDAHCVRWPSSFDEFCDELGYDRDSRKAERIYKATLRQTAKLKKFLNGHFEEALNCEGL